MLNKASDSQSIILLMLNDIYPKYFNNPRGKYLTLHYPSVHPSIHPAL